MKDANAPQEDVIGLFRKFGGDAATYKEFSPADIPTDTPPAVPVTPITPSIDTPVAEPLPGAASKAPAVPGLMAHWRKPG